MCEGEVKRAQYFKLLRLQRGRKICTKSGYNPLADSIKFDKTT